MTNTNENQASNEGINNKRTKPNLDDDTKQGLFLRNEIKNKATTLKPKYSAPLKKMHDAITDFAIEEIILFYQEYLFNLYNDSKELEKVLTLLNHDQLNEMKNKKTEHESYKKFASTYGEYAALIVLDRVITLNGENPTAPPGADNFLVIFSCMLENNSKLLQDLFYKYQEASELLLHLNAVCNEMDETSKEMDETDGINKKIFAEALQDEIYPFWDKKFPDKFHNKFNQFIIDGDQVLGEASGNGIIITVMQFILSSLFSYEFLKTELTQDIIDMIKKEIELSKLDKLDKLSKLDKLDKLSKLTKLTEERIKALGKPDKDSSQTKIDKYNDLQKVLAVLTNQNGYDERYKCTDNFGNVVILARNVCFDKSTTYEADNGVNQYFPKTVEPTTRIETTKKTADLNISQRLSVAAEIVNNSTALNKHRNTATKVLSIVANAARAAFAAVAANILGTTHERFNDKHGVFKTKSAIYKETFKEIFNGKNIAPENVIEPENIESSSDNNNAINNAPQEIEPQQNIMEQDKDKDNISLSGNVHSVFNHDAIHQKEETESLTPVLN